MRRTVSPAAGRYAELEDEQKHEFLNVLTPFRNLYGFLSQVIPFQDSDLEKLYAFLRFLSKKLERPGRGESYEGR